MRTVTTGLVVALLSTSGAYAQADQAGRVRRFDPIMVDLDVQRCTRGDVAACRRGYDAYKDLSNATDRQLVEQQAACAADAAACRQFASTLSRAIAAVRVHAAPPAPPSESVSR